MSENAGKYEDAEKSERNDEKVEVSVVALPHAIAHPRTMVVESLDAVITQAAVAGSRRPEYLAGEAILEFDRLTSDCDFSNARWRAVRVPGLRIRNLRDLFLDIRGLIRCCTRNDAWICERRSEECRHDEEEEATAYDRNHGRDLRRQIRTIESKKESASGDDEAAGEVENSRLLRHHQATITVKLVSSREHLPPSWRLFSILLLVGHFRCCLNPTADEG